MWDFAHGIFALGWMLPVIVLVCLLLMGVMLVAWRMIEAAMFAGKRLPGKSAASENDMQIKRWCRPWHHGLPF